jgi:hypothetical protein
MQKWESIMERLENLIDEVIDNYESKAGIVMLEDMKDRIDEVINDNR